MQLDEKAPVIIIADEGAGIPPEEIEHIFNRFHTRSGASQEGTGLGLAIVKEAARRHGVEIKVESTLGAGSRFLFHFPSAGQG